MSYHHAIAKDRQISWVAIPEYDAMPHSTVGLRLIYFGLGAVNKAKPKGMLVRAVAIREFMMIHFYFAYGSNMNPVQMRDRCPDATPVGVATLRGWEIAINERGVATIVHDEETDSLEEMGAVEGVLWSVTDKCLQSLDGYEGVARGVYRRKVVQVERAENRIDAVTYVASSCGRGDPRPGYLELILEGADQFGISSTHRSRLERLSGNRLSDEGNKDSAFDAGWGLGPRQSMSANSRSTLVSSASILLSSSSSPWTLGPLNHLRALRSQ